MKFQLTYSYKKIETLLYYIFLLLIVRYQFKLLTYKEWGDESDTIVITKMLASGMKLYSEIFSMHGPLVVFPGLILESISNFSIEYHRAIVLIIMAMTVTSIYYCPLIKTIKLKRIYSLLFFLFITLYCPGKFYSHTYTYQAFAGYFLVIVLAQYIFPAQITNQQIKTSQIIIGNLLLSCLPFLGIIYIPISVLFFFAGMRLNYLRTAILIYGLGFILNFIFLKTIGSLTGYYVFHIYFNAKIMPLFSSEFWPTTFSAITINLFLAFFKNLSGYITLAIILFISCNSFGKQKNLFLPKILNIRAILIIFGFISLLIRGSDFHALPYYLSMFCVPLLFLSNKTNINKFFLLLLLSILFYCLIRILVILPQDKAKFDTNRIPVSSEFSTITKKITNQNDKIIVYTSQNVEYILSQRLPASGSFTYFPNQVAYNKNPVYGIKVDGCEDIKSYKPKIMMIDKLNLWGRYPWESYGGCVQKVIDEEYVRLPNKPYYIRSDIYAKFFPNLEK